MHGPARAQVPPPTRVDVPSVDDRLERGLTLHRAWRVDAALAQFRAAVALDPEHYGARWAAAAEAVVAGMLETDPNRARTLFAEAVEHARTAVALEPDGVEGHEWLSVALGRHALSAGLSDRVSLAEEIRALAQRTLDLNPDSPRGHHVLGQWHSEVRRLNRVERFVARRILGGASFGDASWEAAEHHLRRSIELEPVQIVHHVELARVYLETDRPEEARALLLEVTGREPREPTDPQHIRRARDMLRSLGSPQT